MAHPKRRQSKTRTRKRRTHDVAVAPTLAVCPNCGESLWKAVHDESKFTWGKDVIKNIEEKFINDPTVKDKINVEDFPCKYYE